ncbi:GOLPH3/VPS74 family protein [Amycolatopsis nigrescens]|uniref:GOLPH3/VPS74 family protein n=1 Tax=Amycolatopsis nigrescens TaxID=381445 RepID=UPI0003685D21|nr:GPP34 family phosphoprotein [Amycolatopsis nigrescens]
MTELALPTQAYLLACDLDRQRVRDRQRTGYLVRAAGLTELLIRGRLADDGGSPRPAGRGSTGDDVLDELLGQIVEDRADRPRKWKHWVRKDFRSALRSVEDQLSAAALIEVRRSRVLGLFPRSRVRVTDPAVVRRLRSQVDDALRGGQPPARLERGIAALTALVAAAEVKSVVSGRDRRRYADRLRALEERGGGAVPALRKVLKELRAARNAAIAANNGHGGS